MTDPGLEAKISDLIALAGVLPRDAQHAASNFRALPETEIDRRLDRLRQGKQRLDAWRIQHGLEAAPAPEPVPAGILSRPVIARSPHRLFAEQLEELGRLISRVQVWQPPVPELLAGQIQRRIREFADWNAESVSARDLRASVVRHQASEDPQRVMAVALRWITRDIEALISHPLLSAAQPRLTPLETIKGLARLENELTARQPELLVALNQEGLAIANVVRADLGLRTPLAVMHGAAPGQLEWQMMGEQDLGSVGRVCVVGHLARTGATMVQTMQYARARFGAAQVYGTVLAASVNAADRCVQAGMPLYYHYLSAAEELSVGYDVSQGVAITENSFILGGRASGSATTDALPIDRATLGVQRAEIATEFTTRPGKEAVLF